MNGKQKIEGVFQLVNFIINPTDKERNPSVHTPNKSLWETIVFTLNLEYKGCKTTINLPNDKNNAKNRNKIKVQNNYKRHNTKNTVSPLRFMN